MGQEDTWTKMFVIGGFPNELRTEIQIIDMANDVLTCAPPTYTPSTEPRWSAGTYIEDRILVCGSYVEQFDQSFPLCEQYNKEGDYWQSYPDMNYAHSAGSNVRINDTHWMIMGGDGGRPFVDLYDSDTFGFVNYTLLPVGTQSHCTVKVNDTHIALMGGEPHGTELWLFDLVSETWSLMVERISVQRQSPICGVVTRQSGEKEIVIAGKSYLAFPRYN